ncbi:MAG: AMIN domain-containing protein [Deltaproteobacteria bacterium]|nr:AMIN domain-containing protein [Deltaproteobacteria bacterium]
MRDCDTLGGMTSAARNTTHCGILPYLSIPAVSAVLRGRVCSFALFFAALGLCMAPAQASAAAASRIRAISYAVDGTSEKITISLSSPAAFKANVLERNPGANLPCRLYVDLLNTTFAPGVNRNIRSQGAFVGVVRSALNDPHTARVVLELNHALSAGDYIIIERASPPALEIIVHAEKIRARVHKSPEPVAQKPPAEAALAPEPQAVTAPPVISAEPAPLPPVQAAPKPKAPAAQGPRTYLIAIDAGHGGRDPGAIGHGGLKEKHICLAIALELKKVLDRKPGYTTLMTRTADRFVSLQDRARIATEGRADLLISIHGNSHVDARIDGIETYYLNFSSDAEARRVAARENFTTAEEIGDLEMILFDLMQGEKTNISSLLAGYVHNRLTAAITGRYKKMRNLGVKHAPMRVLIDAEMPGILFEAGFISNPAESRRLQDPAHQQLLAEAIADGIHDFFTSSKTALYLNR